MADLTAQLGISRQAVHKHLKPLIRSGEILQSGTTKGALYRLQTGNRHAFSRRLRRTYPVSGLQEDRVFEEWSIWLDLKKAMSESGFNIVRYAFSEMLNNVIDHSDSKMCRVEWMLGRYDIQFKIRDNGIGLFHSIETKLGLANESEALGELIKGKTTTMKDRHSGEGIFFTSRAADRITFESHRIQLTFNNLNPDVFVKERRFLRGTMVDFQISKKTRRKLETVFAEYAPEEYEYRFEKTRVNVELLQPDFVSRSEARRLLRGLEKFQEVVLNFKKVKSIGQAFADEIFRVFARQHPSTTITAENVNPVVDTMIRHVRDETPDAQS